MPVLEWVQCQQCGRRHRWKVELVNTIITCACGGEVEIPDLEAFEASRGRDPDATATGGSGALISVDEPERVQAGKLADYHMRGAGPFGMSTFTTVLFWFTLSLLGFYFIVHAIILSMIKTAQPPWWAIIGAVIFVPVPSFKTKQWYKRWLRGRPLSQAVDEELNRHG